MKGLYEVKASNAKENESIYIKIKDSLHAEGTVIHWFECKKANAFDLSFEDKNPGTMEDILRVMEYIKGHYEHTETELFECRVDLNINDCGEVTEGTEEYEKIWGCIKAVSLMCVGEHLIELGCDNIKRAYDTIEKYI